MRLAGEARSAQNLQTVAVLHAEYPWIATRVTRYLCTTGAARFLENRSGAMVWMVSDLARPNRYRIADSATGIRRCKEQHFFRVI